MYFIAVVVIVMVLALLAAVFIAIALLKGKGGFSNTTIPDVVPRGTTRAPTVPSGITRTTAVDDYYADDYTDTPDAWGSTKARPKKKYCRTEDCLNISSYYKASFGSRGLPCDNAYLYACNTGGKNVLTEMRKSVQQNIESHFLTGTLQTSGQSAHQKALMFYKICKNTTYTRYHQQDDIDVMSSFLQQVGLTFQEDSQTDALDTTLKLTLKHGIDVFFRFSIWEATVVNNKLLIRLQEAPDFSDWRATQPTLTITHEYQVNVNFLLSHLGINDGPTLHSVAARARTAEDAIFKIRSENGDVNEKPYTDIRDVAEDASIKTKWRSFLTTYSGGQLNGGYSSACPVFLRKFINGAFTRVAPKDLNLYLTFSVIRQLFKVASIVRDQGSSIYFGGKHYNCTEGVLSLMKHAATSPYLMSVVNSTKINGATAMAMKIRDKVVANMQRSVWLEEPTKSALIRKLQTMKFRVGFPKGLRSVQEVDDYYSHFPDISRPFMKAYLDICARLPTCLLNTLRRQPADILSADFDYVNVVLSYQRESHMTTIPAGALVCPQFNYGAPPEVNYGNLGRAIAHEMMHAFDDGHRTADEDGRPLAWTATSEANFQTRMACLNQSRKSTPRARRTIYDEYQADNLASRALYEAYKEEELKSARVMPGLKGFSPDQIFFLARCYLFCAPGPYADSRDHPNLPHRCNVPLANAPEYATAFNCPAGSPENPAQKCVIW